jgi:hypothetical protein
MDPKRISRARDFSCKIINLRLSRFESRTSRSLKSELFEHALWKFLTGPSRSHVQSFDLHIPFTSGVPIGEDFKCKLGIRMPRVAGFE